MIKGSTCQENISTLCVSSRGKRRCGTQIHWNVISNFSLKMSLFHLYFGKYFCCIQTFGLIVFLFVLLFPLSSFIVSWKQNIILLIRKQPNNLIFVYQCITCLWFSFATSKMFLFIQVLISFNVISLGVVCFVYIPLIKLLETVS